MYSIYLKNISHAELICGKFIFLRYVGRVARRYRLWNNVTREFIY